MAPVSPPCPSLPPGSATASCGDLRTQEVPAQQRCRHISAVAPCVCVCSVCWASRPAHTFKHESPLLQTCSRRTCGRGKGVWKGNRTGTHTGSLCSTSRWEHQENRPQPRTLAPTLSSHTQCLWLRLNWLALSWAMGHLREPQLGSSSGWLGEYNAPGYMPTLSGLGALGLMIGQFPKLEHFP